MDSRPIIWLGVFALHAAALAGLSGSLQPESDMIGGAPIIHLTLAPRASFDGVNTPQTSATSATPSPRAGDPPGRASAFAKAKQHPFRRPLLPPANVEIFAATEQTNETSGQSGQDAGSGAAFGPSSQASEAGLTQGGGAPVVGAAAASTADTYEAAVLEWIERHKRHPGGPSGIVTVRFTLDRRGALTVSEVVTGSGFDSVDHAALAQLRDAAPFPRPSSTTPWRTREFVVRIDFRSLGGTRQDLR